MKESESELLYTDCTALAVIFNLWPAKQFTITVVALFQKKFETPALNGYLLVFR
jgi:hypothetical protein